MFDIKTFCIFQLLWKLQNIKKLQIFSNLVQIRTVTSHIKAILLVISRHFDIWYLLPVFRMTFGFPSTLGLHSLGKPIDSYWFKMSCLNYLVFICVHCFFLKMMKLYKDICPTWISRTSAEFFSHKFTS